MKVTTFGVIIVTLLHRVTAPVTMSYDTAASCPGSAASYNAGRLVSVSTTAVGSALATALGPSIRQQGEATRQISLRLAVRSSPLKERDAASGIMTGTYPSTRAITTSYDGLNRPVGVGWRLKCHVHAVREQFVDELYLRRKRAAGAEEAGSHGKLMNLQSSGKFISGDTAKSS